MTPRLGNGLGNGKQKMDVIGADLCARDDAIGVTFSGSGSIILRKGLASLCVVFVNLPSG
jgi:hypothetical protein